MQQAGAPPAQLQQDLAARLAHDATGAGLACLILPAGGMLLLYALLRSQCMLYTRR